MTLQKTNRTSIMASFATLKSLSDVKKYQSPYQILREFINYIIVSDSLYSFSAVEIAGKMKSAEMRAVTILLGILIAPF